MNAYLADLLVCPACRGRLTLDAPETRDGRVLHGSLLCDRCRTAVPICAGFPLFGESRPGEAISVAELRQTENRVMGDAAAYARSVEQAYRDDARRAGTARPTGVEEAAALPFADEARFFDDGEVIVDVDGRTGWSSELLAGLFPRRRVVAICDGDRGPLGYAGFRHWLGEADRAANLDIVFQSGGGAIPLAEGRPATVRREAGVEGLAADARVVINPAWTIDPHLAVAHLDADETGARDRSTVPLSQEECELLFWADRCLTLEEIGRRTARPTAAVAKSAAHLAARRIVEVRRVSRAMAALQYFYRTRVVVPARERQTLQALWRESHRAFASRPLLIVDADGSVFRYEDAADVSLRVAAALRRAGVRRGDVVAACNSLAAEVAFTVWGCAEAGAVFAGLDRNAPVSQTREILEWLRPKLLLCHAGLIEAVRDLVPCVVYDTDAEADPHGMPTFADWIDGDGEEAEPQIAEPADPDEVGVLYQTSGTSGRRKCVEISHGSLYRTGLLFVRTFDLRPEDVVVSTGDTHASQGLRTPLVSAVAAGASFVVVAAAERRNPMALAEAIRRHRGTVLVTVPGTLQLLAQYEERLRPEALASLRLVVSVSSALPRSLADAFRARFGVPVVDQYGLTESPFATSLLPSTAERAGTSVGVPLETIVQIVGDDGAVLGPGEVGELRLYSENSLLGYRGPASESGVRMENGWCHSADVGVRDEQGFVTLLSRRRDIIKGPSGDLIFPAEIEEVVKRCEGVLDAGACGFRTPEGDERIALFVVAEEAPQDPAAFAAALRKRVLERLGTYRVPSRLEIVEALPRLHDGSLLRHELAARCG